MILKVSANKASFHTVYFEKGLNLIVADTLKGSSERDSRNGVGKTLLFRIIDFCLGSKLKKDSEIMKLAGQEWKFELVISLNNIIYSVVRSVDNPTQIRISQGPLIESNNDLFGEELGNYKTISDDTWKALLGKEVFSIRDESSLKDLSFRQLIGYFIRTEKNEAMQPFMGYMRHKEPAKRLCNTFLLGLDWEAMISMKAVTTGKKDIEALKRAMKLGYIKEYDRSIDNLEAARVELSRYIDEEDVALKQYTVLPTYRNLETEVNELTARLHELNVENHNLTKRMELYNKSLQTEVPPSSEWIVKLYKECCVVFPDNITCTLEEAEKFHQELIKNRKEYLDSELKENKHRLNEVSKLLLEVDEVRKEKMLILETSRALEEFTTIQERLAEKRKELSSIENIISSKKDIDDRERQYSRKALDISERIAKDYKRNSELIDSARMIFSNHTKELYEKPGQLLIGTDEKGYTFGMTIPSGSSSGIKSMMYPCYDLLLLQINKSLGRGIDFIIHDSAFFEGVDERQKAKALVMANRVAIENDAQYITAINSDAIPEGEMEKEGLNYRDYIRLTLGDDSQTSKLLGIQFG